MLTLSGKTGSCQAIADRRETCSTAPGRALALFLGLWTSRGHGVQDKYHACHPEFWSDNKFIETKHKKNTLIESTNERTKQLVLLRKEII